MSPRNPVEFTDDKHRRVGNRVQLEDETGLAISFENGLPISSLVANPENFVYSFLTRVSGPQSASTNEICMNTNSAGTPSVFEYQASQEVYIQRINFELIDGGMQNQRFAGLNSALSNGCLFEIIDDDGIAQVLDFLGGNPITMNDDFLALAGVDSLINVAAGDDAMLISFSIGKAGAAMKLATGQKIRFTIQDNLEPVTRFRGMVQGIIQ